MAEIPETAWLRRAPVVAIYDVGDVTVVLGREGRAHRFDGDSAHLVRAMLSILAHTHTRAALLARLAELAGAPIEDTGVIDEALALLLGAGAVERVADPTASSAPRPRAIAPRVVLGITGAVASAYTPSLLGQLLARGYAVRVVATPEAMRFVRAESIEALTHAPLVTAMWIGEGGLVVPHIALAQWADLVVVAPASATTVGRLAAGDFSSIVSAVALSTTAPVVVVPSMNTAMFDGAVVQRNLAQLVDDGMHVVHPAYGNEVAEQPAARTPILGASPPGAVIGRIVEAVLATHPRRTPGKDLLGHADAWDEVYRGTPEDRLPWQTDTIDDDLAAHVDRLAPEPTDVLDVGAGLGGVAIACASRGHRVVAVDISAVAIERAAARAPAGAIVWLVADVTEGRIHGSFGLVIDRGCLHLLDAEGRRRYAHAAAQWCRPGGALLLKAHDDAAAASRGTQALSAAELQETFGPAFVLEAQHDSAMPGPGDRVGARLFVLRRVGD
jgi:SAM-dependent methyltransferase/3-polyprenyl-4-hydroxybenzoate decarboxylase